VLKSATNDLGKGHFVLARDPLGVAVKLIWELDLCSNHTSNLHLYLKYINNVMLDHAFTSTSGFWPLAPHRPCRSPKDADWVRSPCVRLHVVVAIEVDARSHTP
jgi:hypothetical protein